MKRTIIVLLCCVALPVHADPGSPPSVLNTAASSDDRANLDQAFSDALQKVYREKSLGDDTFRTDAYVDLNGDRRLDAIVLFGGPQWSGSGGHNMFVFRGIEKGFAFVNRCTVSRAPIHVCSSTHNGWRDILVYCSGGGADSAHHVLRFDGAKYPLNPTAQPTRKPAAADTCVLSSAPDKATPEKLDINRWGVPGELEERLKATGLAKAVEISFKPINPYYLVADYDGDGKRDYAVWTHDRVLKKGFKQSAIHVLFANGKYARISEVSLPWHVHFKSRRVRDRSDVNTNPVPVLRGDAITVVNPEKSHGIYYWDGESFRFYFQSD